MESRGFKSSKEMKEMHIRLGGLVLLVGILALISPGPASAQLDSTGDVGRRGGDRSGSHSWRDDSHDEPEDRGRQATGDGGTF